MLRLQRKSSRATKSLIRNERGFILPMVLGYGLVFSLVVMGLTDYATSTARQINAEKNHIRTLYAAEAATEKATEALRLFIANSGTFPQQGDMDAIENSAANFGVTFSVNDTLGNNTLALTDGGAWQNEVLTTGNYTGLNGSTRTITVDVATRNTEGFTNVEPVNLQQVIEVQLIPIFQFGIFYQNDLEILPGNTMTFSGPVHSNGDIYLGADGSTLNFDSTITAFGSVFHGRKDSANPVTGNVWIKDGVGVNQNMKNGDGTWLDSNASNWLSESAVRWDGNVKTSAENTLELSVPIPTGSNPHSIIERRSVTDTTELQSVKMDYKAHIRIIDGQVFNAAGAALDLRYCAGGEAIDDKGTPDQADDTCAGTALVQNPFSSGSFWNYRENKMIQSLDINMGTLINSPAFKTIANAATNGVIIYHSDYTHAGSVSSEDALRIVNGSRLYKATTVVSENPLYIKGDYNNEGGKKASGIIADAFNILSNNWNDVNSTQTLSNRVASNTTVQTAVITGNQETSPGQYNGGFENIHRFLEKWSGKTLTYKGSVIVLFNSTIATGNWGSANTYSPPVRVWSFDTDFSDPNYSIHGYPSVYQVTKQRWSVS